MRSHLPPKRRVVQLYKICTICCINNQKLNLSCFHRNSDHDTCFKISQIYQCLFFNQFIKCYEVPFDSVSISPIFPPFSSSIYFCLYYSNYFYCYLIEKFGMTFVRSRKGTVMGTCFFCAFYAANYMGCWFCFSGTGSLYGAGVFSIDPWDFWLCWVARVSYCTCSSSRLICCYYSFSCCWYWFYLSFIFLFISSCSMKFFLDSL